MVPTAAEKAAAIIARVPAGVVNAEFCGFESKGTPQYAQKLLFLSRITLPHLVQFTSDLNLLYWRIYRLSLLFAIYVFTRIQEE